MKHAVSVVTILSICSHMRSDYILATSVRNNPLFFLYCVSSSLFADDSRQNTVARAYMCLFDDFHNEMSSDN